MRVTFWDQEGRAEIIMIKSKEQLLHFFDTFGQRDPFYCEFVETESKLSVCVRGDLASVQHSPANDAPPYRMAVTTADHDADDEVDFFIGNETTPISARYALPLELAKHLIVYFLQRGERDSSVHWEEI
jgi:hypothetical protein